MLPLPCWICSLWLQLVCLDLSLPRSKIVWKLGSHVPGKDCWALPPKMSVCHRMSSDTWKNSSKPLPASKSARQWPHFMVAQVSQACSEVFVPSPVAELWAVLESCSHAILPAAKPLPTLPTQAQTSDISFLFFDWVSMSAEIPFSLCSNPRIIFSCEKLLLPLSFVDFRKTRPSYVIWLMLWEERKQTNTKTLGGNFFRN